MNIFGSNYEEVGNLSSNLVLQTAGKVKIRFGQKFIDLIDEKGNINASIPKILNEVKSKDEMKSDGLYILDGDLYVYYRGNVIQATGVEGHFIDYENNQKLSQEQITRTQKNIGLTFNSTQEATNSIENGIVFVKDKIYYVSSGNIKEIFVLEGVLKDISKLEQPSTADSAIIWDGDKWQYINIITREEFEQYKQEQESKPSEKTDTLYTFDPIQYSVAYLLKSFEFNFTTVDNESRTYSAEFTTYNDNLENNNIVILSIRSVYSKNESIPTSEGQIIEDSDVITLNMKYNNQDKLFYFITPSGDETYYKISEEIYKNKKVVFLYTNNKYYGFINSKDFFNGYKLYVKANSKKEKFRIDYDNAEISLEENYPTGNNGKPKIIPHTVFGDMEDSKGYYNDPPISFRTIHDRDNPQGLYSDQAVFTGVEFRGKWPDESANLEVKDFPRYSTTLNDLLCSLEEVPEEYNQVIPSVQFIKNQLGGDYIISGEYVSEDKKIYLYKSGNQVAAEIDTTDFIKDGMVSKVEVDTRIIDDQETECLIITFNEDSGQEEIDIPLSKIFDSKLYYTKEEVDDLIEDISGEIPAAQVQSDWNENDESQSDFIKNKPTKLSEFENDSEFITREDIPDVPTQTQANWNETDTSSAAYIQNKPDIYTKTEVDNKLNDLMPLGSIIMWAYRTIPNGWHICDGTILNRDEYEDFVDTLGPTLPDLRGRFIVGIDGDEFKFRDTGGEKTHTLTLQEIPSHDHNWFGDDDLASYASNWGGSVVKNSGDYDAYSQGGYQSKVYSTSKTGGQSSGTTKPHNNLPPYYALYYIIKIKKT